MGQMIRYYLGFVALFAAARAALGLALFGDDPGRDLVVESLVWAVLFAAFWLAFNWKRLRATPDAGAAPENG